jgi:D-amino-acid dehydrogenase
LLGHSLSSSRTVVIVGAGIVGLSAAWYARRDGHRVIVVERGSPDRDCCSLGNSGLVVPSHVVPLASPGALRVALRSLFNPRSPLRLHPRLDPEYLRWCWLFWRNANEGHVRRSAPALLDISLLSKKCYEELAQAWGNRFHFTQQGMLMLCATAHGFEEEAGTAEFARGLGIPADVLDARAAAALEPGVDMQIAGAVRYPLDSHLAPQLFVAELTRRLQGSGVELCWATETRGWKTSGAHITALSTGNGDIAGDEFVLAAGSWSGEIARTLGMRLPLQAGKGYNLTLPQPRVLPRMSSILLEARIAVTPMGSTLRFAGTLQLAGLNRSIDPRRVHAMVEAIPRYYPQFSAADFKNITPWSGLRPCSPDGMPYIGRTRRYSNLIVASGHAMMGMSLGPGTGLLVSDLVGGRPPSMPLERFDPDRFA